MHIPFQVDAGLQLEGKKVNNFKYMFDVRTSKRTYYLAANSEEEMNKWVDTICYVCGLRIQNEGQETLNGLHDGMMGSRMDETPDNRYSPQPSQDFSFNSCASNAETASITSNNTSVTTFKLSPSHKALNSNNLSNNNNSNTTDEMDSSRRACTATPTSLASNSSSSTITEGAVGALTGPSSPYIPISECHTGKPINGFILDCELPCSSSNKASSTRPLSSECYDVPRPLNPVLERDETTISPSNNNPNDLLYQVPSAPTLKTRSSLDSSLPLVPRVNWSTYPNEQPVGFNPNDATRTSTRSYDGLAPSGPVKHIRQHSDIATRSSSPLGHESRDSLISLDHPHVPPPRPPKPASLRRSKTKSESCASLPNVTSPSLYDVPATAVEQGLVNTTCSNNNAPQSPDASYDFPRATLERDHQRESLMSLASCETVSINETVPLIGSNNDTLRSNKKHAYTNAPPGYFVNKDNVFVYDYKPSLPSSADEHNISFVSKQDPESSLSDRSPLTPNSASYTNTAFSSSLPNSSSLVITPPAVNRDLKPRRKGSDSDRDSSNNALNSPSLTTMTIKLDPPPVNRIYGPNRSFRKPKVAATGQPQLVLNKTLPHIPSRAKLGLHNRDPSTSEDDLSNNNNINGRKRRDSNNDEQSHNKPSIALSSTRHRAPAHFEGDEIQYLDLDLDSDSNSQSPRTPNDAHQHVPIAHQRSGSNISTTTHSKESPAYGNTQAPVQATLPSGLVSTVYKKVDFLKTEAFNKMRQHNTLETYRNSQ
ncbi:unnamed protein product [Sphagnum balticum]